MINSVAFNLFGIDIYYYGLIIAAAVVVGIFLAISEAKRRGKDTEMVLDICLIVIPMAVIFGRLYYVLLEWDAFSHNFWSIFNPRTGGMAIYGAIIGGALGILIYCKWKKFKFKGFIEILDIFVPALVLGQAMGRWGNFFNNEAYGFAISNPKWQFFPFTVPILGSDNSMVQYHLATFFYESMWCLMIFLALWFVIRKRAKRVGTVTMVYLGLYGIERAVVELLRTDSLTFVKIPDGLSYWELMQNGGATLGQFPVSSLLSILLTVAAITILIIRMRKPLPAEEEAEAPQGGAEYDGDEAFLGYAHEGDGDEEEDDYPPEDIGTMGVYMNVDDSSHVDDEE